MLERLRKEKSLSEERVELKYVNRLCDNGQLGFRFCEIDSEDLEVVKKIFTTSLGYYITNNGKFLNWE